MSLCNLFRFSAVFGIPNSWIVCVYMGDGIDRGIDRLMVGILGLFCE